MENNEKNIIEVEVKGIIYKVECTAHYSYDSNYGADADGRRGTPMYFVEDIEITDIRDENDEQVRDSSLYKLIEKVAEGILWDTI
jgi:hypothetical protein